MKKSSVTAEQVVALREKGMTRVEIAKTLDISIPTVDRRLAQAKQTNKSEPENKPIEVKQPASKPTEVKQPNPALFAFTPPATPAPAAPVPVETKLAKRASIPDKLFSFAYVPNWEGNIETLSQLASPESWSLKISVKDDTNRRNGILMSYIYNVFSACARLYSSLPVEQADQVVKMNKWSCCIHTGLYTARHEGIYMQFSPNKASYSSFHWFFEGFVAENSPKLYHISPLPKPHLNFLNAVPPLSPEKEMRVNIGHILDDPENKERLPETVRHAWNQEVLLDATIQYARRKAFAEPDSIEMGLHRGEIQYFLPMYFTNPETPDGALCVSEKEDIYYAETMLTLPMTYRTVRTLKRPTAQWLTELVEPVREVT